MIILPPVIRYQLRTNAIIREMHTQREWTAPDPKPVVKFFATTGAATWLATELDRDNDTLFGLADLGMGCPELGSFSLAELGGVELTFGLFVERDTGFASQHPLSRWAATARRTGSIIAAEIILRRLPGGADQLPDA